MFFIRRKDNLAKLMSYVLGSAEPQGAWIGWGVPTPSELGMRVPGASTQNVNSNSFSVKVCTSPRLQSEWSH